MISQNGEKKQELDHDVAGLHNLGEANLPVAHIELAVRGTHEDVTHDNKRTNWGWDVLAHEGEQALSRALVEGVILLGQIVGGAIDDDVDVWGISGAINGVLAVERRDLGQLLGAHGGCNGADLITGHNHEGCASRRRPSWRS